MNPTDAFAAAPGIRVRLLSGDDGPASLRFFEVSPFCADGRYVAYTRYPYEDREPRPGDTAHVVIRTDVQTDPVAVLPTTAWDSQLGAQVQWCGSGHRLAFNVIGPHGRPQACIHDLDTNRSRLLEGPVYQASPDGMTLASADLTAIGETQRGYGVHVDSAARLPRARIPQDDGIWLTEVTTGRCRLACSIADLLASTGITPQPEEFFYCFHVMWNHRGDRLLVVVRAVTEGRQRQRRWVLTCAPHGEDAAMVVDDQLWARPGHHPNWTPDGDHILMNLTLNADSPMQLVQLPAHGGAPQVMVGGLPGSGHPRWHPRRPFILTDAYRHEPFADKEGSVPLRLLGHDGNETHLLCVPTAPRWEGLDKRWRIDPHPAWDHDRDRFAFNAAWNGTRHLFLADLTTYAWPVTEGPATVSTDQ